MQRRRSLVATADAFAWTEQKRQAAGLVAESNLPFAEIAERVGVARETVWKWRRQPAFQEAVAEIETELDRDALNLAITRRRSRLEGYDRRREKALAVIQARAEHYAREYPDVPGGNTGLLAPIVKSIGGGAAAYHVTEHFFDSALARELRALEEQASRESGQWVDKAQAQIGLDLNQRQEKLIIRERRITHMPPRDLSAIEAEYRPVKADAEPEPPMAEPTSYAKMLAWGAANGAASPTERELKEAKRADAAGIKPTKAEIENVRKQALRAQLLIKENEDHG